MTAREITERAVRASGMQKTEELFGLVNYLLLDPPRKVVEIGSASGGSFLAWCEVARMGAVLVSVDIAQHDEHQALMRGYARAGQSLHFVRGDSHDPETVARVSDLVGGSVDFLFIDADHSSAAVRADYENFAPLVRAGGTVALHDVADQGDVALVWSELIRGCASFKFVQDEGDAWGGIGVLKP